MTAPAPISDDADFPPVRLTPFWRACQQICRFVGTVFFDLKCYDMHNVPLEGGVLMLSNHQSFLDPPLVGCRLQRAVCFMARASLWKVPILGPLMPRLHTIPVERGKANIGTMKKTIQIVQSGRCLLMFPEGTRSIDGSIKPLESGMALIIKRAKVPVVPVAIDGAFEIWPRDRKLPHSGHVRVKYGKPLLLHDRDAKEIIQIVESEIRRLSAELKEMREAETPAHRSPFLPIEA